MVAHTNLQLLIRNHPFDAELNPALLLHAL